MYDSNNGGLLAVYGTSVGAPQWSALIAIADQGRTYNAAPNNLPLDGPSQTLYALYTMGESSNYSTYFHDVTTGSSSNGLGTTFNAMTGYDLVTGLGSPIANAVVTGLVGWTGSGSGGALTNVVITPGNGSGAGSGAGLGHHHPPKPPQPHRHSSAFASTLNGAEAHSGPGDDIAGPNGTSLSAVLVGTSPVQALAPAASAAVQVVTYAPLESGNVPTARGREQTVASTSHAGGSDGPATSNRAQAAELPGPNVGIDGMAIPPAGPEPTAVSLLDQVWRDPQMLRDQVLCTTDMIDRHWPLAGRDMQIRGPVIPRDTERFDNLLPELVMAVVLCSAVQTDTSDRASDPHVHPLRRP
jgi:hypothetical protein